MKVQRFLLSSGKPKKIAVYDCSGKLLRTATLKEDAVDVRRDLALSTGFYIVKVKALEK